MLCDPCGRHFRKTKTLPKRKRRSLAQHFAGCTHCGSQFSPQWRGGPPEKPTLCNACGLHYRKTKSLPDRPPVTMQTLLDLSHAAEAAAALEDEDVQDVPPRATTRALAAAASAAASADVEPHEQRDQQRCLAQQPPLQQQQRTSFEMLEAPLLPHHKQHEPLKCSWLGGGAAGGAGDGGSGDNGMDAAMAAAIPAPLAAAPSRQLSAVVGSMAHPNDTAPGDVHRPTCWLLYPSNAADE